MLAACAAPPVDGPGGEALRVRSPVAGTVFVGDVSAPVAARGEVVLGGLGAPPHVVTLETGAERVTVIGVDGPVVDLGGVIEAPTPLRGEIVTLVATVSAPGQMAARALTARQVIAGREVRPGRYEFEVPAGEGPVELVAVWSDGGRARRFGRVVVTNPRRQSLSLLALEPTHTFDERVAVSVDRYPTALVAAELTYAGQPTGLRLGEGLAEPRVAAGLPRPGDGLPAGDYGLWITATARRPGGGTVATVGEQHALGDDAHLVRWPAPPDVAPAPAADAAEARPLGRRAATMSWTGESLEATWVEASLVGDGGCGARRWRVFAPAAAGEALFPSLARDDVLEMPVISGRFETVSVAGRAWADLFAEGATPAARLPAASSRIARRAVTGWWRGETPGCGGAPLAGRYAVVDAAKDADVCGVEADVTHGLVDRCGRWVPLSDGGPGEVLRCARVDDRRLVFPSGAARTLQPVEWGDHDAFVFDQPDGPRVMVATAPPDERVQAVALAGTWHRVEVRVRHFALGDDGQRGRPLEDAHVAFAGGAEKGPWLEVSAGGDLRVVTPAVALQAVLTDFDGRRGVLALQPDVCADGLRTASLSFASGALVLALDAPGVFGGEPAVRVTTLTFTR